MGQAQDKYNARVAQQVERLRKYDSLGSRLGRARDSIGSGLQTFQERGPLGLLQGDTGDALAMLPVAGGVFKGLSKTGRLANKLAAAEADWKRISGLRTGATSPRILEGLKQAETVAKGRLVALQEAVESHGVAAQLKKMGVKLPKAVDNAVAAGAELPAKGLSWIKKMSKIAGLGVLGVAAYQGGSAAGRYAAGQMPEPPDPVQAAANRAEINRRSGLQPPQTQQDQGQQGLLGPRQGPQQPTPDAPMNIAQTLQQVFQDRYGAPPADGGVGYGYRMGPSGYRPNYAGDYRAQVLGPSTNDPRLNRQYQQQLVEEQQGMQNAAGLGGTLGQVSVGNTDRGLMRQQRQFDIAQGREPLQRQLQAAKFALLQQKQSTAKALALIEARGKQSRLTNRDKALLAAYPPDDAEGYAQNGL